ncbi:MAG: plasmid mobilization protein [Sulfuriferula sp.]
MARPKLHPDNKRTSTIHIRVSPWEYRLLRDKAAEAGLLPAQLLRHAALSKRMPPPPPSLDNVEKYRELSRLSANLNQLAHQSNAGNFVQVNEHLLFNVIQHVKSLRMLLLGEANDSQNH